MIVVKRLLILTFLLVFCDYANGQSNPDIQIKKIRITDSITVLDSLSIIPSSFIVFKGNDTAKNELYDLDFSSASLLWKSDLPVNLRIEYRTFSANLSFRTQLKDTNLIQERYVYKNPFRIDEKEETSVDVLGLGGLNKSGSISRGLTVGNNQNLAVNSSFNLQLSGKIADDISIMASITDNNIPIQPDGNTQQLQDFDQVFIQLYNEDKWKLIAGDFITARNDSYFMRFQKKAKGISFEKGFNFNDSSQLYTKTDLAISRGKFATNTVQGIEGNQGPYKLIGSEGEQTIIVLSGTEQVFIDGRLLKRGADQDYTIDYNTAEIIFTPQQLITKNKRIVIQFQYSDKNYVRSLANVQATFTNKKWKSTFNFYSEQDHKNQPLQQELNDPEKQVLFNAGDDIQAAFIYRDDSVGFEENTVLYNKKDSLGYSIFEFSQKSDSNLFRLRFSFVGAGNGNYIQDGFSAFGRVYRWVKPDTINGQIIKRGDHEPVILLIAPKTKQLISFENTWEINDNLTLLADVAMSNNDINTFSKLDEQNDIGLGTRFGLKAKKQLQQKKNPWVLSNNTNIEFISIDFQPVERYRPVEFSRNWNILSQTFNAPQLVGNSQFGLSKSSIGSIKYAINLLDIATFYQGIKHEVVSNFKLKKTLINYNGSYLSTQSNEQTSFYRHIAKVEQNIGRFKIGYEDETERNLFKIGDSLIPRSYQFYDGMAYIANGDSSKANYKLYARFREEKNSSSKSLSRSAFSNDLGLSYTILSKNKKTKLTGNTAYRKLTIIDSTLGKAPDNTFISQTDFSTSIFKRLIQWNTYYEIGSGLEQKREFIYIQVNSGQGNYAWIDYNENGVKELNEFEIAIYQDQADYIRVFTQSNNYITAYTNKFSQSIRINPKQLFRKSKSKFLKGLAKFSTLTAYKVDRKTTQEKFEESLNPFIDGISDTNLLSINKQVLASVFFNRTGYKYGISYNFQDTRGKTLLSNGFDSRANIYHEVTSRYKVKKLLFNWDNRIGNKSLISDFLSSRNYSIAYLKSFFNSTFQKDQNQFFSLNYTYEEKKNTLGLDFAVIHTLGAEATYNIINNVNLNTRLNYLNIVYNGSENSSLEYEILNGLKKGNNFTWEILLNKKIAKNLSLTLNYNGRKPEGIKTIHSGTIEMRAFF